MVFTPSTAMRPKRGGRSEIVVGSKLRELILFLHLQLRRMDRCQKTPLSPLCLPLQCSIREGELVSPAPCLQALDAGPTGEKTELGG